MITKNSELLESISKRFNHLYPGNADQCMQRLNMLLGRYGMDTAAGSSPYKWSQEDAFLITYGNTLYSEGERPLATLRSFLNTKVKDVLNTVHILPFFPYSSDDGFSVIDYRQVNPELGTWNDIQSIASDMRLMSDLVINHVSRKSNWFQDYVHDLMPEKHYFIEADPADDLSEVVRPRSEPLLTPVHTRDGLKHVWTTFSDDQIDLDFSNPDVLFEFLDILMLYVRNGIKVIRLDAIAYLWKKNGTSCIHLKETHEVVKLVRDFLELIAPDATIITETNVPHEENISYFGDGDEAHMVYQFPLPPLILHAILTENCRYLTKWAQDLSKENIPDGCTFFNFTASHDGIGLRPLEGLIPENELNQVIDDVRRCGGKISTRTAENGADKPYELNITFFDAVSDPEADDPEKDIDRFICSQAIALSLKGIPAVYIHSLLGTRNDYDAYEKTGQPRSLNRAKLPAEEVEKQLADTGSVRFRVFRRYRRLLHCRSRHAAFHPDGQQEVLSLSEHVFAIARTSPDAEETILCLYNLSKTAVEVKIPENCGRRPMRDIITGKLKKSRETIMLEPYKPQWLSRTPGPGGN